MFHDAWPPHFTTRFFRTLYFTVEDNDCVARYSFCLLSDSAWLPPRGRLIGNAFEVVYARLLCVMCLFV